MAALNSENAILIRRTIRTPESAPPPLSEDNIPGMAAVTAGVIDIARTITQLTPNHRPLRVVYPQINT